MSGSVAGLISNEDIVNALNAKQRKSNFMNIVNGYSLVELLSDRLTNQTRSEKTTENLQLLASRDVKPQTNTLQMSVLVQSCLIIMTGSVMITMSRAQLVKLDPGDIFKRDAILKNAKLLSEKNDVKVYRKLGGKEEAIRDFQELKPYKTRGYRNTFWHFALAGDRKALLNYEDYEVTLSIWKYETSPNGQRKRVMDKILY